MPADLFDISSLASSALSRAVVRTARPLLDRLLGLATLNDIYRTIPAAPDRMFPDLVLNALRIQVSDHGTAAIPPAGPVIVTANHPHGALDGLALASVVRRVRPDVRLLANHRLACVPELAKLCFFVDPFNGPAAASRSRAGLRDAHLWLRRGGVLIVFPAGEVAWQRDGDDRPVDSHWHDTVGRLALLTGATISPAIIAGANSEAFYQSGRISPWLRTALLGHELLRQRGSIVQVTFAPAIGAMEGEDATRLTDRARRTVVAPARVAPPGVLLPQPAGSPTGAASIADEIATLPGSACLHAAGAFKVFCATASQAPLALREIGRLREIAFRAVGEGTGLDVDLDRFDLTYQHLILWDAQRAQIAGAYRLGCVDRLRRAQGLEGLYTRTLFRYDGDLLSKLGPAIELGRSFIREEYQRQHAPLLLLWKGICQFIARQPHYRVLFGPVSISASYPEASRRFLVEYLRREHGDPLLASSVDGLHPPAGARDPGLHMADARGGESAAGEHVDAANREFTALSGGQPMPVLLRHYLKLGGRVLGFNVDPAFNNALDALLVVDLERVDPALLARYFGDATATRLRARHAPAAA